MGSNVELGGGEHVDDTGHRAGVVDVDVAEHAVGDVGAYEHGMQPAGKFQIGEVAAAPGEEPGVLGAQHPSTEDGSGGARSHAANLAVRAAGRRRRMVPTPTAGDLRAGRSGGYTSGAAAALLSEAVGSGGFGD